MANTLQPEMSLRPEPINYCNSPHSEVVHTGNLVFFRVSELETIDEKRWCKECIEYSQMTLSNRIRRLELIVVNLINAFNNS